MKRERLELSVKDLRELEQAFPAFTWWMVRSFDYVDEYQGKIEFKGGCILLNVVYEYTEHPITPDRHCRIAPILNMYAYSEARDLKKGAAQVNGFFRALTGELESIFGGQMAIEQAVQADADTASLEELEAASQILDDLERGGR